MVVCKKHFFIVTKQSFGFFILLLGFFTPFYAQTFYSVDKEYLKYKTEGNNLLTSYRSVYPDTTLVDFHNYFPRNFLGNVGLSSPDYFLKYGTDKLGFRFFDAPIKQDKLKEEDVAYFQTKGPYADLTGIAGSKQLQVFKLNFTHTFRERLNFNLKFNRYSSLGFYRNQQSFANNLVFNGNYTSKPGNFGYYFYVLGNLNKNKENGGIVGGVLNDSTVQLNKDLLPVRLDSASRENRELKFMFNPWFKLNRSKDSLSTANQYIQIKSFYSSTKYKYRDQSVSTDNFYNQFYFDTLTTNDSSHVQKFSNELTYSFHVKDRLIVSAGFKNEYNDVWQKQDSLFFNQIATAGLVYRKGLTLNDTTDNAKEWETIIDGQYVAYGSNEGDYRLEIKNSLFFQKLKKRQLYLNLLFESRHADYIYNNWTSNHFVWANTYNPQSQIQAKLGCNWSEHFSAHIFYQGVANFLYFDTAAIPKQHANSLNNAAFSITYSNIFFKHLGLSFNHIFQTTSNQTILRLPQNTTTANLYFYANLFNRNMQLLIGAQAQVYQSFVTYDYMPATQSYYLQNRFNSSDFPYLDAYLKLRIRPAAFFVKVENILAGFDSNNFALVPGYYQPDMAFRFGLTWMFFD